VRRFQAQSTQIAGAKIVIELIAFGGADQGIS